MGGGAQLAVAVGRSHLRPGWALCAQWRWVTTVRPPNVMHAAGKKPCIAETHLDHRGRSSQAAGCTPEHSDGAQMAGDRWSACSLAGTLNCLCLPFAHILKHPGLRSRSIRLSRQLSCAQIRGNRRLQARALPTCQPRPVAFPPPQDTRHGAPGAPECHAGRCGPWRSRSPRQLTLSNAGPKPPCCPHPNACT